jgi:hypothetical protein
MFLSIEDLNEQGIRRSPRLHNRKTYAVNKIMTKIVSMLTIASQIKITDDITTQEERINVFNRKMVALFNALKHTFDNIDYINDIIKGYKEINNAILDCVKNTMRATYYKPCYFKEIKKFDRMNQSLVSKVRRFLIKKWMEQNWVQAFSLNRAFRNNNIPSVIYIYVMKFYGDYSYLHV